MSSTRSVRERLLARVGPRQVGVLCLQDDLDLGQHRCLSSRRLVPFSVISRALCPRSGALGVAVVGLTHLGFVGVEGDQLHAGAALGAFEVELASEHRVGAVPPLGPGELGGLGGVAVAVGIAAEVVALLVDQD